MSSKSCLSCHTVHTAVEKYNQDDDVYSSKYTYSKQTKSLVTQSDFNYSETGVSMKYCSTVPSITWLKTLVCTVMMLVNRMHIMAGM